MHCIIWSFIWKPDNRYYSIGMITQLRIFLVLYENVTPLPTRFIHSWWWSCSNKLKPHADHKSFTRVYLLQSEVSLMHQEGIIQEHFGSSRARNRISLPSAAACVYTNGVPWNVQKQTCWLFAFKLALNEWVDLLYINRWTKATILTLAIDACRCLTLTEKPTNAEQQPASFDRSFVVHAVGHRLLRWEYRTGRECKNVFDVISKQIVNLMSKKIYIKT